MLYYDNRAALQESKVLHLGPKLAQASPEVGVITDIGGERAALDKIIESVTGKKAVDVAEIMVMIDKLEADRTSRLVVGRRQNNIETTEPSIKSRIARLGKAVFTIFSGDPGNCSASLLSGTKNSQLSESNPTSWQSKIGELSTVSSNIRNNRKRRSGPFRKPSIHGIQTSPRAVFRELKKQKLTSLVAVAASLVGALALTHPNMSFNSTERVNDVAADISQTPAGAKLADLAMANAKLLPSGKTCVAIGKRPGVRLSDASGFSHGVNLLAAAENSMPQTQAGCELLALQHASNRSSQYENNYYGGYTDQGKPDIKIGGSSFCYVAMDTAKLSGNPRVGLSQSVTAYYDGAQDRVGLILEKAGPNNCKNSLNGKENPYTINVLFTKKF